jgi:hypothetical protein
MERVTRYRASLTPDQRAEMNRRRRRRRRRHRSRLTVPPAFVCCVLP